MARRVTRQLYLRLYVAFLGVLIAIVLVSAGVVYLLRHGPFPMLHQGPRVAAHVARALPPLDDHAAFVKELDEAHDELGLDLVVVDEKGHVLAEAGEHVPLRGELPFAKALRGAAWVAPGLVGAPLNRSNGVLLVRLPLPAGARGWPIRTGLLIGGALLVSAMLLYPLSRSITLPLETLTAAAEAFGRGDQNARSGLAGEDEVGRLARSFDEMAARIQAARRAEKELLANVSHELRTPLARLMVAIELIDLPAGPAGDALRARLKVVTDEVEELSRLVGDVLTAARLDLATMPLRKEEVDVGEVLQQAKARALALSSQPIEIVCPSLRLVADLTLLGRALDTLVDNARKYAEGKPVRLSAEAAGELVRFSVKDEGQGFAEADLPRVFEPFFRGDKARSSAGGYGLGLSLARRVAEAHGGKILAKNLPTGGGCVELELPRGTA